MTIEKMTDEEWALWDRLVVACTNSSRDFNNTDLVVEWADELLRQRRERLTQDQCSPL